VVGNDGNPGGRRERLAIVAANMTGTGGLPDKKHRKGKQHVKVRSGAGYDL